MNKSRNGEAKGSGAGTTRALVSVAVLGLLSSLLSAYLWRQLLVARAGGPVTCGLGLEGSCAALWDAPLAGAVHRWTGVPVAGWGLIWGLLALLLPLLALTSPKERRQSSGALTAIRWLALGGLASIVALAGVSFQEGIFCPGCATVYVLVGAYAVIALFGWRGRGFPARAAAAGRLLGALAVTFLALLYPGLRTPRASAGSLEGLTSPEGIAGAKAAEPASASPTSSASSSSLEASSPSQREQVTRILEEFLSTLPPEHAQYLSDTLERYRRTPTLPLPPPRHVLGPRQAPVQVTEWTDPLCSHCADLHANWRSLEQALPAGSYSLEPRFFPLDGTCNPRIARRQATDVRCVAVKAEICLERSPAASQVSEQIFEIQQSLTVQDVYRLAAPYLTSAQLRECIESEETERKLAEDISAAAAFGITGTPLVVINGRSASAFGPFLYSMILAGGDPDHPGFASLPPPGPEAFSGP